MINYEPGMKLYKVEGLQIIEMVIDKVTKNNSARTPCIEIITRCGEVLHITCFSDERYNVTRNGAIQNELNRLQIKKDIIITNTIELHSKAVDIETKMKTLELMLDEEIMYYI